MKKIVVAPGWRRLSAVALTFALVLQGCGGNSSSTTSGESVTGVAAMGAPISLGAIKLLGANGQTKTADIDASGNFSIDFTGLTRPILVRVEGVAGGTTVVQYSAVTPAVGGVLNANPVTTAIVTLAMGADPGVVFENADLTAVARLTDTAVGNASATLTTTLNAARAAAGVSTSADVNFHTGSFTANKTGLDRILDLVKVRVEPDRSVVVANKTADSVVTVQPPTTAGGIPAASGSLGTVESINTNGIDTLGSDFQQLLANVSANFGSGGTAAAQALFDVGFFNNGVDAAAVIGMLASASDMTGAQLLPSSVSNCTGASPNYVCDALFTIKYTDGALESFGFPVRRQSDASWRLYGNQAPLDFSVNPVNFRAQSSGGTTTRAGFNVAIRPFNNAFVAVINNTATAIDQTVVYLGGSATGTPVATLYAPGNSNTCSTSVQYMVVGTGGDCGNFISMTDSQIDQLKLQSRPKVTLVFKNGATQVGQPYTTYLETVPLKSTEVTDDRFAVFSDATWSAFQAANAGGTFTLAVSKAASVGLEDIVGAYPASASTPANSMPFATVRSGTTFSVKKATGATNLIAVTRDAAGRVYWYQRN